MMWDDCIAGAIQVFTCKDTVYQHGLQLTCLTPGNSVLHLKCEKLMETWDFCIELWCSLSCAYTCEQIQAHSAWPLSYLADRVHVAMSEAVRCWLIGFVERQAYKAVLTQVLGWQWLFFSQLEAGAKHWISQEDSHFYWWFVAAEMTFVLPVFVAGQCGPWVPMCYCRRNNLQQNSALGAAVCHTTPEQHPSNSTVCFLLPVCAMFIQASFPSLPPVYFFWLSWNCVLLRPSFI